MNSSKEVKRGTLVSKLVLADDVTARPDNHVAYFDGEHPCRQDGTEIEQIKNESARKRPCRRRRDPAYVFSEAEAERASTRITTPR